jgi:phage shock protein A
MKARASAVSELQAAGTFEDFSQLGSGEDDIDRQLRELSSSSEVDAQLAKMKAELGAGPTQTAPHEIGAGESTSAAPAAEPADAADPAPAAPTTE